MKVYAGYNVDQDIRLGSSSGGMFSLLADRILDRKGVVYGVKMSDDCYSAEFTRVTSRAEMTCIRGSKYLQAKMGNTFKQVKDDLLLDKPVLFSGTGCQINGLKKFLGREYDHLLCVDVICHGAPSPALWKKYAEYQESKNGGKLRSINFRCKDDSWIDFGMKEAVEENNSNSQKKMKQLYISKDKDTYMQMFLRDYCLRPSCYDCAAKKQKMSDLTIADFWGIDHVAPEMNDGNGTSLILIRTDKGEKAFEQIRKYMKLKEVTYEAGVKENPAEYKSCAKPPQREHFFKDMRTVSYDDLRKKYVPLTLKSRIKGIIKSVIKPLKIFVEGGQKCKIIR